MRIMHHGTVGVVVEGVHAGARSNPEHYCGVHIHIHEQGHTPQSLRTLANLMASHEDLIAKAVNLDRNREIRYCRMVDHTNGTWKRPFYFWAEMSGAERKKDTYIISDAGVFRL